AHEVHVSGVESPDDCASVSVYSKDFIVGGAADIVGSDDDKIEGIGIGRLCVGFYLNGCSGLEKAACAGGQDRCLPQDSASVGTKCVDLSIASGHISNIADVQTSRIGSVVG